MLLFPQKALEIPSSGVTCFCFTFIPKMPTNTGHRICQAGRTWRNLLSSWTSWLLMDSNDMKWFSGVAADDFPLGSLAFFNSTQAWTCVNCASRKRNSIEIALFASAASIIKFGKAMVPHSIFGFSMNFGHINFRDTLYTLAPPAFIGCFLVNLHEPAVWMFRGFGFWDFLASCRCQAAEFKYGDTDVHWWWPW